MKLYEILNGYMGESYVRCLVIAKDKETAIERARVAYKERWIASQRNIKYKDDYYKALEAHLLCDDTEKEFVGIVTDG